MNRARCIITALAVAGALVLAVDSAAAQSRAKSAQTCVDKGGKGTGSTIEDARFQAWEAVLQATSWPMWAAWITSGAKVGQAASGYSVSNVRQKCGSGGMLGKECIIRAKLCHAG
jgi:hypothetical protein